MYKQVIVCFFLSWIFPVIANAQSYIPSHLADSILKERGEVVIGFPLQDSLILHQLSKEISIDNIKDGEVFAYANKKGFDWFSNLNIPFRILTPPSMLIPPDELRSGAFGKDDKGRTIWNFYPSWDEYLSLMEGFASAYPDICKLDTIGYSTQGRILLAVKISDNVAGDDPEPQFLYTSSIHGDETAGYVLMLHLIDYLLQGYGANPEITQMINKTEIFINPLANPDGTYHGGNNSVYGAIRFNANNIDINRNFPDPEDGPHPDGNDWQVETEAFMEYAENHHFIMSANFHGGAEVFNYPWDTWSKLHADDAWWQLTGREWADTVHQHAPPGYFDDLQNGITNGYAWYTISGGRQDYMNYWHACREVTLEISNTKLLPTSQLLNWWEYNYRSFLNYIRQAGYGFAGFVTDTVTGTPLEAKVFIFGHDKDGSTVYSRLPDGFYSRPVYEGTWGVTFSAEGYYSKYVEVPVTNWNLTNIDVQLRPLNFSAGDDQTGNPVLYPNPCQGIAKMYLSSAVQGSIEVRLYDLRGKLLRVENRKPDTKELNFIQLDYSDLPDGIYLLMVNDKSYTYTVKMVIQR